MAAMTLVGRDEMMGVRALRRRFNARMDPSNDSISTSMARCWHSREFEPQAIEEPIDGFPTNGSIVLYKRRWVYLFFSSRSTHIPPPLSDLPFRLCSPLLHVAEFDGPRSRAWSIREQLTKILDETGYAIFSRRTLPLQPVFEVGNGLNDTCRVSRKLLWFKRCHPISMRVHTEGPTNMISLCSQASFCHPRGKYSFIRENPLENPLNNVRVVQLSRLSLPLTVIQVNAGTSCCYILRYLTCVG
ncbi:hypothetical protein EDB87DRAFT_854947 [Lactarius vividus]|nr:hypothetical protein EDB87DRAFT_854947 [Lactarius vividus]